MTPEDQYKICDRHFKDINSKLDKIYDKMFEDNGNPCLQTKIDRNSRWISAVTWVFGVIYAASVGVIAWFFRN